MDVSALSDGFYCGEFFASPFKDLAFNLNLTLWKDNLPTSLNSLFVNYKGSTVVGIEAWDVSSVTDMRGMFYQAGEFDSDIGSWNVSSVTDMHLMFHNAPKFNQDLSCWPVSGDANLDAMFLNANNFESNLNAWPVAPSTLILPDNFPANCLPGGSGCHWPSCPSSSPTALPTKQPSSYPTASPTEQPSIDSSVCSRNNLDMPCQTACELYNAVGPCRDSGECDYVQKLDISLITDDFNCPSTSNSVFEDLHDNLNLTLWKDNLPTSLKLLYKYKGSSIIGIDAWNVSHVKNMYAMFSEASKFDSDIGSWDVSSVTDMRGMFNQAYEFNQDLSCWPVSQNANLKDMFRSANNFESNLNAWPATNYDLKLRANFPANCLPEGSGCEKPSCPSSSPTSSPTKQPSIDSSVCSRNNLDMPCQTACEFYDAVGPCRNSEDCNYVQELDVSALSDGFYCRIIAAFPFDDLAINLNLTLWKDNLPTSLDSLFGHYNGSTVFGIEAWDVSSVIDMSNMFTGASKFNSSIGSWNVSSVTDMSFMFRGASKFDSDIGSWDVSSVTDMYSMFEYAIEFNSDIGSWDVSKVTDMGYMFRDAHKFNQDLSCWPVSEGAFLKNIFLLADKFESNLNAWPAPSQNLGLPDNFPANCLPGGNGCTNPGCPSAPSASPYGVYDSTRKCSTQKKVSEPVESSNDTTDNSYILPLAISLGAAGIGIIGVLLYKRYKRKKGG